MDEAIHMERSVDNMCENESCGDSCSILRGFFSFCVINPESNEQVVEDYLRNNADRSTSKYREGYERQKEGRLDEAISSYTEAIQLDGRNVDAIYNLGSAFQEKGDSEKAAMWFLRATELDPRHAMAHYNMGCWYYDVVPKNLPEAKKYCLIAAELNPRDTDMQIMLGMVFQDMGSLDEACRAYLRAMTIDPSCVMAYYNLGNMIYDQKHVREAIKYYRQAVQLDPNHADAFFNLGIAYQDLNRPQDALKCYEAAHRLDPQLLDAKKAAAMLRQKLKMEGQPRSGDLTPLRLDDNL